MTKGTVPQCETVHSKVSDCVVEVLAGRFDITINDCG